MFGLSDFDCRWWRGSVKSQKISTEKEKKTATGSAGKAVSWRDSFCFSVLSKGWCISSVLVLVEIFTQNVQYRPEAALHTQLLGMAWEWWCYHFQPLSEIRMRFDYFA